MTFTLRYGLGDDWVARMTLQIDAGQLEEIAFNVRQFFDMKSYK